MIDFGDTPEVLQGRLAARFPKAELRADDPDFSAWVVQVVAFIEAPGRGLDLPLDIHGTAFQHALESIAVGSGRLNGDLRRDCETDWSPHRCASSGSCLCVEPRRRSHPLPPNCWQSWRFAGLSLGCRPKTWACWTGRMASDQSPLPWESNYHSCPNIPK